MWRTKEDLLLACQLAALKAGFSQLETSPDANFADICNVRCAGTRGGARCQRHLVKAEMVDRTRADLGWRVVRICRERFEAPRHPNHQGVSRPLQVRVLRDYRQAEADSEQLPQPPLDLKPGDEIAEGQELHLLEGSLRAAARRKGFYLSRYFVRAGEVSNRRGLCISCSAGRDKCHFFIHFVETEISGRFRCKEIIDRHNCGKAELAIAGGKLSPRLDAFVSLRVSQHQKRTADRFALNNSRPYCSSLEAKAKRSSKLSGLKRGRTTGLSASECRPIGPPKRARSISQPSKRLR